MSFKGEPNSKDLIEDIERSNRTKNIPDSEIDSYEEIVEYFGDKNAADEYLTAYHDFFDEYEGAFDYLKQVEDTEMSDSEIIESLEE